MATVAARRVYGPGEVIAKEGFVGDTLYVLHRGQVSMMMADHRLGTVTRGAALCASCLLRIHRMRRYTYVAETLCHVVELSRASFLEKLEYYDVPKKWLRDACEAEEFDEAMQAEKHVKLITDIHRRERMLAQSGYVMSNTHSVAHMQSKLSNAFLQWKCYHNKVKLVKRAYGHSWSHATSSRTVDVGAADAGQMLYSVSLGKNSTFPGRPAGQRRRKSAFSAKAAASSQAWSLPAVAAGPQDEALGRLFPGWAVRRPPAPAAAPADAPWALNIALNRGPGIPKVQPLPWKRPGSAGEGLRMRTPGSPSTQRRRVFRQSLEKGATDAPPAKLGHAGRHGPLRSSRGPV